ncbi:MAG: Cof-type HAD-IIB family hydrolase [Lachnospiraceae bacterium]|nr:Cof-type HAD-IIB family hydrolase [Lachnospiraceae bacterium]
MDTKIFFTDLDGTLLNDQKEITSGNQAAVDQALQGGHKIVIATGRPLASALIQADRLGLMKEGCYVIAFNGGEIYDCFQKHVIYRRSIPLDLVREIFEAAHRQSIHIQTFSENGMLAEEDRPEIYDYVRRTLQPYRVVSSVSEALSEEPCKVLAIEEKRRQVIEDFQKELLQKYQGVLDCYFSNESYLEIVPAGVSKGNAVRWMCDFLKIPIENSVSAGDAPNDIDMIQATRVGAVMCNAFPGVVQYGNYITQADNNHDGVAEIIHRFILEGR